MKNGITGSLLIDFQGASSEANVLSPSNPQPLSGLAAEQTPMDDLQGASSEANSPSSSNPQPLSSLAAEQPPMDPHLYSNYGPVTNEEVAASSTYITPLQPFMDFEFSASGDDDGFCINDMCPPPVHNSEDSDQVEDVAADPVCSVTADPVCVKVYARRNNNIGKVYMQEELTSEAKFPERLKSASALLGMHYI
ncbi:uncharacterized protein LOC131335589 [Rhododendron vialii]|uniref:uncharacterized protein LOC131335589 n=1 Tax=Rhododendron vialii TaxID=182163 RepID=UPI00265F1E6C|nr:uncharacterized protein LOC131335589 [Rhododendron vialii]